MDSEFDDFDRPKQSHIRRRILAAFIDYALIFGLTYAYIKQFGHEIAGGYAVTGLAAFGPVLIWLLLTVTAEQALGATIGNGIAGLKPVQLHGGKRPATLSQSLVRHLADPLDIFFFGLVGILTIQNTVNRQRLGDIWAGTIVVREK